LINEGGLITALHEILVGTCEGQQQWIYLAFEADASFQIAAVK
jgi:hypothetical protein